MKHFKEQDIKNFLVTVQLAAKPLPGYVKDQLGMVKEYLGSDRYYKFTDSPVVWKNGHRRHKEFEGMVEEVMGTVTTVEEKEFLQRLLKGYGHPEEASIIPELSHPAITQGGKTSKVKFFEKYGVEGMEDVEAIDVRLTAAKETVAVFVDGLDLPGSNRRKYMIYRDESVVVDKVVKEALVYHQPVAIPNTLHDHIGRWIDHHWYEIKIMSDYVDMYGSYMTEDPKVWFGKVRDHEDLLTVEIEHGKKGFLALMRKR